ncbi:hypothetical protein UCRNP2_1079 [Neofusicoccum parvum UCRNP2]|uniref:Protein kinase domain-containing protein n=1 Tax=Botryosphaeria parva (strain UCR-NP2) TaxID=1287680 RepID=R1EWY8_BOTPV|nr:hypothetical protein UCRNP2_1079 [Neofusicoccum parvum UCRNP2]
MDSSGLNTGRHLGRGRAGSVYKASDGTVSFALKTFRDEAAFFAEKAAYERIQGVGALKDRVPHYHGSFHFPPHASILMEKVDGLMLCEALPSLSSATRNNALKQLEETLHILHHNARPQDIIAHNSCAQLLDFSTTSLQEQIPEALRERQRDLDLNALRASRHVTALPASMQNRSTPQKGPNQEEPLAQEEKLALPLADRLALRHREEEAVPIPRTCPSRPWDASRVPADQALEMRVSAARCTAQLESAFGRPEEALFDEAGAFYLGAVRGAAYTDAGVLALRFELAENLRY